MVESRMMDDDAVAGGHPLDTALLLIREGESPQPCVMAFVRDIEGDLMIIEFDPDEFRIGTAEYEYLLFDDELLTLLVALRQEAAEHWRRLEPFQDEDGTWTGWEHLADGTI